MLLFPVPKFHQRKQPKHPTAKQPVHSTLLLRSLIWVHPTPWCVAGSLIPQELFAYNACPIMRCYKMRCENRHTAIGY